MLAKSITEMHDAQDSPVPVLKGALAGISKTYGGKVRYDVDPKPGEPGHYQVFQLKKKEVDGDYTPGGKGDWSIRGRLREAGLHGLPGGENASGPFRFRPPGNYNPSNPLPKGRNGGYLDRGGNEWVPGPYHGDPKLGYSQEWDVWLTKEGENHWNKFGNASKRSDGGLYLNVRPDGFLSH